MSLAGSNGHRGFNLTRVEVNSSALFLSLKSHSKLMCSHTG
jgi:hypothetical protein